MRRVAVSLVKAGAVLVGLVGCGGGSGPDELVIAQLVYEQAGSSGSPLPSSTFRFSLAGFNDPGATRVFDGVGVTPADQGETFTVGPGDDAQFAALAALLTNGVDDPIVADAQHDSGGIGEGDLESGFVVGLDPGFTPPDLAGFTITRIQLVVDQFSTMPSGGGTQFQFIVRFVFLGTRP